MNASNAPALVIIITPIAEVEDGHGGWIPPGTVVNTYMARIAPLGQRTAREQVLAEKYTDDELEQVILPVDAILTGESTLTFDGIEMEIVGIVPTTSYPMERKVVVRRTGA